MPDHANTVPGLKLALAQINPTVGDLAGNADRIRRYYRKAADLGADMVITPELSLTGYPPEDLALMPSFVAQAMAETRSLAEMTAQGPALIVGSVWEEGGKRYNAALCLAEGKILHIQPKTMLPNYGVFDEERVFVPGDGPLVFTWKNRVIGLLVCEDIWSPVPTALMRQKPELLIVVNASPFESGKMAQRHRIALTLVAQAEVPLIYLNLVGGQDDLVFDGGSFACNPSQQDAIQLDEFTEQLSVLHWNANCLSLETPKSPSPPQQTVEENELWRLWQAMALGLRDYAHKNGFTRVVLGLSGGIDSALTAALAVDALGANQVKGILLPSPYSSVESEEDALHSAKLLGIETMTIPIGAMMDVFEEILHPTMEGPLLGRGSWMNDLAVGGNLQARLRGVTLMALSNRFGWMLLSTGNKSEIAVGYSTLYGDSCGAYNVLKDLYKTQVYALARWRNSVSAAIPQRSIDKAPSAELAPGQTDQDQLPPYDVLDAILHLHIEGRLSAEEIIARGYDNDMVRHIVKLVRLSEYKRRQSCPGVKLSPMLFGKDRRYPLTNKF